MNWLENEKLLREWTDIKKEEKITHRSTQRKEEDIGENEDQTFQDGTLDDGITPSPEGLRGRNSPDWPQPERDHGHVGETDEQEGEEMGEVVGEE